MTNPESHDKISNDEPTKPSLYNEHELMLTVDEFALLSGRKPSTISAWCDKKRINYRVLDKRRFIPLSELNGVCCRAS